MESTPLPLKRDPLEAIRAAFGTADLRRLQFGWAASAVGSWALMVVLAVYAYDAGGASAVGVAALVRMLPAAFAAPITSLLADRSGVGWLNAAWGVGGLLGGTVALGVLRRGRIARGLAGGCVLAGVALG